MFVILLIMYFVHYIYFLLVMYPILNDVIKDDFVYKNQLVHEVEVFKNVNVCTRDIYISFYIEGVKNYGYLSKKKDHCGSK